MILISAVGVWAWTAEDGGLGGGAGGRKGRGGEHTRGGACGGGEGVVLESKVELEGEGGLTGKEGQRCRESWGIKRER